MLNFLLNKIITNPNNNPLFSWSFMVAPINSLLKNQPWASERLKKYQGNIIFVRVTPILMKLTIDSQGEFEILDQNISQPVDIDHQTHTEIEIPPTLLPRLWLGDDKAIYEVKIKGNHALGSELAFVYRNLKLDFTEDLSKLFGDAVATKIVKITQRIAKLQEQSLKNFAYIMTSYINLEEVMQKGHEPIRQWIKEVDATRDDTARLEKRIELLRQQVNAKQ